MVTPMALIEDLTKRQNIPTTPDSIDLGNRLGRVSETVKDVFVWELRNYFNTKTANRTDATPSVDKFTALLSGQAREQDPYETVVRILRQYPDLTQKMPFVGVAARGIRNNKMAFSGKFVDAIKPRPELVAGTGVFSPTPAITPIVGSPASWLDGNQPIAPASSQYPAGSPIYGLVAGDYVEFTTIIDGVTRVSHIVFTQDLLGIAPQTPRIVADIINCQALYVHASVVFVNSVATLVIVPGGPLGGGGNNYSIQRTAATANFDLFVNFPTAAAVAPSNAFPAVNRYLMSYFVDIGLTIMTEDENLRTELTDLMMDYYSFVMDDRHFTYYGRSFYGDQQGEAYQFIIKDNEINMGGEQEVPRQDDPTRKIYLTTIQIPVIANQYIDRAVSMGVAAVPLPTLPTQS
jgi:hypothetical protein